MPSPTAVWHYTGEATLTVDGAPFQAVMLNSLQTPLPSKSTCLLTTVSLPGTTIYTSADAAPLINLMLRSSVG